MIPPLPLLQRVATTSPGIARIPRIASLLGAEVLLWPRSSVDAVVGWGRKPNTRRARALAAQRGVPFLALEDGFVRSIGLGVSGAPAWSIVVDDVGIYYDATQPSRLELLLEESAELDDPALLERARRCIAAMRTARISKYNASPVLDLGPKLRRRVLVVDQTAGDLSLRGEAWWSWWRPRSASTRTPRSS
jgi:capsular polysaccharide export protein